MTSFCFAGGKYGGKSYCSNKFLMATALNRRIIDCTSVESACALCEQNINQFNGINTASAIHRLAILAASEENTTLNAQILVKDTTAFHLLSARAVEIAAQFKPRQISALLWAHAKLRIPPSAQLLAILLSRAAAATEAFEPTDVSNLLWAVATLGLEAGDVVGLLSRRAAQTAHCFNPQHISNVRWALATLQAPPDEGLLAALQAQAEAEADGFREQNIANLLWALATMGVHPTDGCERRLSERAVAISREFKPQAVVNLVWAYARLRRPPGEALMRAMARRAAATADDFKPRETVNLLWSLASAGLDPGPELVAALSRQAERTAGRFEPRDVANLVWALATMGVEPEPGLAAAMWRRTVETAGRFESRHITTLMWASAMLGAAPGPGVAAGLGARAVAVAGDFHAQGVANLAWALATLRADFGAAFRRALAGLVAAKAAAGAFAPAQLSQVHQALLVARADGLWGDSEEGRALLGDAGLARRCREAFEAWGSQPSSLEEEVAGCLRAMGAAFDREAVEPRTGYAVDFLVRTSGGPVALEVDGPTHFVGRAGQERRRETGPTALKARLLRWAGRRTVAVRHWEWSEAGRAGVGGQRRYLEVLLRPPKAVWGVAR